MLQEIIAFPDPTRLDGVIAAHVNPAEKESVKETVASKWLRAVTTIVELASTPTSSGELDVAVSAKSRNWSVAVPVRVSGVLVPVSIKV